MKFVPPPVRVRLVELRPEREDSFARGWETLLRVGREAREKRESAAQPTEVRP